MAEKILSGKFIANCNLSELGFSGLNAHDQAITPVMEMYFRGNVA
ncbi:hypothetical protein QUF80_06440 [Desulfococcaceae bacterium HSG8]|nr:hypothetical protein [Desulfococcaceae bacterium HSG8]